MVGLGAQLTRALGVEQDGAGAAVGQVVAGVGEGAGLQAEAAAADAAVEPVAEQLDPADLRRRAAAASPG